MERITSARELSTCLVERFRRDGFFRGPRFVDKGELIIPLVPTLEQLRQSCVKSATLSESRRDNVADLADEFACRYEEALLFGHSIDSVSEMIVGMVGKQQAIRATYEPDDPVTFFAKLNCTADDWQGLCENTLNAERKANRARERALKRSRRNTKNPKKKGKCR